MSDYTEKPWRVAGTVETLIVSEKGKKVCIMAHRGVSGVGIEEMKANAQLIAAAPELLDRLEKAKQLMKSGGLPIPLSIEQTIDKAKGDDE